MKTNFKNIAAVSAVVFAGVFSANATENNSGLFTSVENTTVDYRTEAQLITRWFADMAEAKATQMVMDKGWVDFSENIENTDFRMEAQLLTRLIADKEEAKTLQKLMEDGKIADSNW